MHSFPLISAEKDLLGKRILLRADFNVPLEEGLLRDTFRIDQSLPTINFLRSRGARVIILSHIGVGSSKDTLQPVAEYLNQKFPVTFLKELMGKESAHMIATMQDGEAVLLENLRHNPGEEKNDPEFAQYLASLGDVYVNDAFSVSHRAHASIVGVPALLPSYAGLLMAEEVKQLAAAFAPKHPFLFVLGGAKISTKMPLLKKFLNSADHVLLGGAIVNNFLKASGYEIGKSVYDESELDGLSMPLANKRLILPVDVVVKNENGKAVRAVGGVLPGDMIVDVGPETIHAIAKTVGKAALIIWNGPLGYYEEGFTDATRELFTLVADARTTSIVGGGDTVALINEMGFFDRFSFVSTGGGAMLDFLLNETLPGIDALKH